MIQHIQILLRRIFQA